AGIALIAALALGAVLLAILRNYYANEEFDYLLGNAQSVSKVIIAMISADAPHDEVQSQIENLAFLIQTRIQVYSLDKQLIYDSGSPQNVSINFGVMRPALFQTDDAMPQNKVFISVGDNQTKPALMPAAGEPGSKDIFVFRSIQAGGSAYGFELRLPGEAKPVSARSDQWINILMLDPENNEKIGLLQLSEGPAYGSYILRNVAVGWAFASAIAVLLAAIIGAYISRRISAPILALTGVTTRMARGDLTGRADVESRDEFGQLARSFNEMADQVEGTVSTLRRFVSDAAHELRTPLTALRTNLDLALDENNVDNRMAFLSRAQAMVQRLEELNTNLLDLSRLEANGHNLQEKVIDLKGLLQKRSETYASQAEQAGLIFESQLRSDPIFIRADVNQITRVLDNLMDNACKFTPQGGTIRIALSQQDGEAIFSVTDSGIGIPADDLPQIFNRFHRGRNTTAYEGSGLGLAIVKAITTTHGGQVEVQSAGEGKGSRFSIRLPVVSHEEV
ncbi:MAG TPA: HAMP domain-containing sensor histidine kinase, partial [Anaerolineales bacterium]|nr:HAMP domain-containing sensor histidine kinase [Anaerolineales bacterium]